MMALVLVALDQEQIVLPGSVLNSYPHSSRNIGQQTYATMIPSTAVAYLIALVLFAYMGRNYGNTETSLESIQVIRDGILAQFRASPVLLVPPFLVAVTCSPRTNPVPTSLPWTEVRHPSDRRMLQTYPQ